MSSSKPTPKSRQQVLNAKYGSPLPILLPNSSTGPQFQAQKGKSKSNSNSLLSTYVPSLTAEIIVPQCQGVYDPITRSVWVTDRKDMDILFRRGFFGKGTLSRSEPSWRERRVDLLKGGDTYAAELARDKRRQERKQFKIDRAAAMLNAAKTAENVLVTGQAPSGPGEPSSSTLEEDGDGEEEQEAGAGSGSGAGPRSSSPTPSTSTTALDVSSLTPQTYLVRPTRPDANRNRGRKAFKRRPPPPQPAQTPQNQATDQAATASALTPTQAVSARPAEIQETEVDDEVEPLPEEDELEEEMVEELEHLQLSLEEAWFLSAGLGVLKIYDPETGTYPSPRNVLPLLLTPTSTQPTIRPGLRFDDPFLVSYVAYHHFRTAGWVVKPGIKFCADWLLYRRGPVFSHSAFAVVVVPVYEDEGEKAVSPYGDEDWYEERTSWKWMNTIMRVNSLVQKTVVIAYVTIPSTPSFPASRRDGDSNGLKAMGNDMQDLLKRYTIREVILSRFGPARRRD